MAGRAFFIRPGWPKAAKPGFETGTDSDEDAPDRKKFRPLLDTPDIAREVRPTSIVSSHVAESAFDLNRCPSVNNLDLPAHVQSTLSNHMTEFAGIATLRTPLPTSLPLARAFGEYDSDVVNALVGAHCKPVVGSGGKTIDNFCLDIIENGLSLPATDRLARFCVVDLGVVMRRWKYWRATMPRVMPHYAVKCNPDTQVLATLAALGSSFDCASPAEVDMVTALGVSPDRIIYANPCKMPAHLARVRDSGVGLTTFDSVAELHKIYELSPDMKVLLRLRADDPDARCVLGNKYGAEPTEIEPLLTAAKHLGVNVSQEVLSKILEAISDAKRRLRSGAAAARAADCGRRGRVQGVCRCDCGCRGRAQGCRRWARGLCRVAEILGAR